MKDALLLIAGATLIAVGTKYVYDPAGLVTGGVSGLSIVLRELTEKMTGQGVPLWLSSILFNIPIFLLAMKTDGLKSILRSGFVWLVLTIELYLLPAIELPFDNLLLVAIYGGVLFGIGTGMLINARATSGGTDMLGYSLHHFFRHVSMGRIIQIADGIVVLTGAVVFNLEHTLYAVISVYLMGKVTDYVLNTGRSAKMAMIISDQNEDVAKEILRQLDRGVTGLKGTGMYTGDEKIVLLCICSNRDIVQIKDIVRSFDERAFMVVSDAAEVLGEGFLQDWTA